MESQKRAVITGGNTGIGLACAKKYIQQGYDVWVLGRNSEQLRQVAEEYGCHYLVADFLKERWLEGINLHPFDDGLDVLVNNAGTYRPLPFEQLRIENIHHHLKVNFESPVLLTQALLKGLVARKGAVINISSAMTYKGVAGGSIYAATKGALESWTRSLAVELSAKKVRVNAVCPGAIDTQIFNKLGLDDQALEKKREDIKQTIPLGCLGDADDIAQAVFAMSENYYVTGATWRVDGGVGA